jgi:glutamyl-tRNA synthetase
MDNLDDIIRNHAVANRIKFGSANEKAVFGQVLAGVPEARKNTKEVSDKVAKIVSQVNSLDEAALKSFGTEEKKVHEERIEGIVLKDVPAPLVMRFAPNPNGPATLGSARGMVVNSVAAKKYGGKYMLRFDDTDPKTKRPELFAYTQYLDDCKWLTASPDEVYYASDRIQTYYEYAEQLINLGGAYVCFCPKEDFKKLRDAAKPCSDWNRSPSENMTLWKDMLAGKYKDGEAVLRIKTDISHKNPAMRDWVAFRVIDSDHPRIGEKYVVWPMLDFESAIEDHLLGTTLIIRGIDLADSEGRQRYIYNYLKWEYPKTLHWGRVRLEEFGKFSTSMIKKAIAEGLYTGWDDPRLPTLMALRRRGIQPETIRKTMVGLGLGENDVALSMETIYAENRKILDPKVSRYFFVEEPIKLSIKGAPMTVVKNPLHPSYKERGAREYNLTPDASGNIEVYISKKDSLELSDGETIRFMNLFNVKIKKDAAGMFADYVPGKILDVKKIQWVAEHLEAELVTPEGTLKGYCEKAAASVNVGDVIQFERVGFARLDSKTGEKMVYYFGHR